MRKKTLLILTAVITLSLSMLVGCGNQQEVNNNITEQPTTTEAPTSTPTEAPTPTPTETPTPTPTETPTPTPTEAPTSTPTEAPTPTPTEVPTPTPTETPTPTPTEPPHEHAYTESTSKEATCTEAGEKTFTCGCGDAYTEAIEATGHKYGDYVYNNDATYEADGTETATCICGLTDTRTASGTKLEYTYTDLTKTMYAKSAVNVRNLPSTDGEKLGGLSKGQEVVVTGQCNETGWYRIKFNGGTGYVSSSYLQNDKPVAETPTPTPSPEPTPETPSNPSGYPAILNTEDGWYLREDGVYQSPASWEYSSTNITSEWIGKTIAEYCAAQGTSGITFTDPWYRMQVMNVSRWGDYVIGSRKLTTVTYEGYTVDVKIPF